MEEPALIYHVPFCASFRMSTNTGHLETSLWSQLPSECRTANIVAASVACIIILSCVMIHIITMVTYAKFRGDILQSKAASSVRKMEKWKKLDLRVSKEALDYAFAMMTQERLRMAFAFTGLLSSAALLPVILASTAVSYALPFPSSFLNAETTRRTMYPYSITISALFHSTLIASLCILLLMVIERYREIRKIRPDRFIKSGKDENEGSFRHNTRDTGRHTATNQSRITRNRRDDPDIITPRRDQKTRVARMQDTFLYTFQNSYTCLDLVMVLVVPLVSGIITTVSVVVFGGRFEPYGIITKVLQNRTYSINGLISYGFSWFPSNVYTYGLTIGLLVVLCLLLNLISFLKCHTLMSIAKYLPGYQHSKDLFTYVEAGKNEQWDQFRPTSRFEQDEVRVTEVSRNPKIKRQDPDGLSIDDIIEALESSMSSIPPPPVPLSSRSAASLDNISLPPPPRPESIVETSGRPLASFPSLPSMVKLDDDFLQEQSDNEITEVKAEAFFGNIRQTKVVVAVFLLFLVLSAPSLVLFTMGAFYSHHEGVTRIMTGVSNATIRQVTQIYDLEVNGTVFAEVTTPTNAVFDRDNGSVRLEREETAAIRKNKITTLSSVFLILYALAGIAPFTVYCVASRKFRRGASRFFCACLPFRLCSRRRILRSNAEAISRTRSNKHLVNPAVRQSNSFRYTGALRHKPPVKLLHVQLRREKSISGARNVSWGKANHYGTAQL